MTSKKKRGPKPKADSLKIPVCFRVNKKELNRIIGMAKIYTNGDKSKYLRMMVFDYGDKIGSKKQREATK